ncbi:MAG: response regulator [Archangiaceae bacterium]|nr:response regulator [Archangiaceae bacterium]
MKRIMVAEDDPEIRASVAELLQSEGYEVVLASNGAKALELLRGGAAPQLILLDLMMPGVDGFQFREEQRKDPVLSAIPVLLMSAGGDLNAKAAQLGVAGYLKKPFADIDSLLGTIAKYF